MKNWNGRVAVNWNGDFKRKYLEVKDYLEKKYAVFQDTGVIRFVILDFYTRNIVQKGEKNRL